MPTMWEGICKMDASSEGVKDQREAFFFYCCEEECTYFKWDNGKPSGGFIEGQSSSVGLDKSVGKEINEYLPSMFKLLASLSEKKDVEISLNLTIRKGQGKGKDLDMTAVSVIDGTLDGQGAKLWACKNSGKIYPEGVTVTFHGFDQANKLASQETGQLRTQETQRYEKGSSDFD
ncbi:Uncharacterized protein Fot_22484 [Forsythia ovata]|uniref:Uncharacterized protein n=1 Tax=Forsythia ovata TaxID=205694 RepID=A0ABD1UYU6_9LAMI